MSIVHTQLMANIQASCLSLDTAQLHFLHQIYQEADSRRSNFCPEHQLVCSSERRQLGAWQIACRCDICLRELHQDLQWQGSVSLRSHQLACTADAGSV